LGQRNRKGLIRATCWMALSVTSGGFTHVSAHVAGASTDAAVRGFQQALHLDIPSITVDGIVGPVTWQALVSGMLSF
jgi:Putative peptidoglycan binding domain